MLAIHEIWVNETNIIPKDTPPTVTYTIPEENNGMDMYVTLTTGGHNLWMNVTNSTGRWVVETFKFNDVVYHPKESAAYGYSWHWSFGCKNLTLEAPTVFPFTGKRSFIYLSRFQFQPSWIKREAETGEPHIKFGPCNDCTGFFSAGIWGGLFVTFILLLIMFYGISNMMDIRTMDRFDDPKGKTITISAQD